jgi:hypothetical protein
VSAADADPAWSAWTTVTPVIAAPASRGRYLRTRIPFAVAPDADGGYPDLRVIDDRNVEVPFAVDPVRTPAATRRVTLLDTGFIEHHGSQAVLDLGNQSALVDTVRLFVDDGAHPTYFEYVAVDASDDRSHWRVDGRSSVIYHIARDGASDQTVGISATRSRWLRVRILDPHAPFPIDGAEVSHTQSTGSHLVPLPGAASATESPARDQSWTFAFASAMRPAAVEFSAPRAAFARTAAAEWSDDGRAWTSAGDGTIAQFADGGSALSIGLAPQTARYWRVTVHNGNDVPVAGLHPLLLGIAHDAVFSAGTGRSYRLLSGNPAASAPTYDLPARLAHSDWTAQAAPTEAAIANGAYRDRRPIGERFPWLLSAGLILVAIALGGIAIRTIRAAGSTPP